MRRFRCVVNRISATGKVAAHGPSVLHPSETRFIHETCVTKIVNNPSPEEIEDEDPIGHPLEERQEEETSTNADTKS